MTWEEEASSMAKNGWDMNADNDLFSKSKQ